MKRADQLTPCEFELMEALWKLGEGSVKDVRERVGRQRNLAYTTVMTVLDKMRRKGLLHCRKKGKAFIYSPVIARNQALAAVLDGVVEAYFNGSRADFMRFVNDESRASNAAAQHSIPAEPEIDEFLL